MSDVDFKLMHKILQDLQKSSVSIEAKLESLQSETREGFASMKNMQASMYKDQSFLERRMLEAEAEISRIKTALALRSTQDDL